MVGFPKPPAATFRCSNWNKQLETLDVCNLLSLDPYDDISFSEWPRRFRACSKVLHPDKLRGFSPPEGVSMQLLLAVKDWIEAAGDKGAQESRWNSMAAKAREGWCSNWNVMGDAQSKSKPIPAYTERHRSSSNTNKLGTMSPDTEVEVQIVDIIVRERERRPYGPPSTSRTEPVSRKRKRPAFQHELRRSARPNTPKSSYRQDWHPMDDEITNRQKARRTV